MSSTFHFPKIIATLGPVLAKETVLSKVINFVDGLRINLGMGFDEMRKKYIDTVVKLDNSKTILLEVRGSEFSCKNIQTISIKKGKQYTVDYSEINESQEDIIFTDFLDLDKLIPGAILKFIDSQVLLEVVSTSGNTVTVVANSSGNIEPGQSLEFQNRDYERTYLTSRDKRDIDRGMQAGIHIVIAPNVKSPSEVIELKDYIKSLNQKSLKVFSSIKTINSIASFVDIAKVSDGIILTQEFSASHKQKIIDEIIELCKDQAVPVILGVDYTEIESTSKTTKNVEKYLNDGVDAFMLGDDSALAEDSLEPIENLYGLMSSNPGKTEPNFMMPDLKSDEQSDLLLDYIVYNAFRITQETDIRAVVCFTTNGSTASKLSSSKIGIPMIAFTKSDESFRYINLLWGVKGYKISNSFNYENLKKIGKEMIRIIFKGNISLDDKILIVLAHEEGENQTAMMNGLELYKFKDI